MTAENILIAIDHDDSIAPFERLFASAWSCPPQRIVLAAITPTLKLAFAPESISGAVRAQEEALIADLKKRTADLKTHLTNTMPAISVEIEMLSGGTAAEIAKSAVLNGCDLVIKLADKQNATSSPGLRSGLGLGLGRVETSLIRRCPIPVWIMPPDQSETPQKIAVAMDDPAASEKPGADKFMPQRLIDQAANLANAFGITEICVVHAWTPPAFEMLTHPRANLSQSEIDKYVGSWESKHQTYVEKVTQDATARHATANISFRPFLVMGAPESVIPDVLQRSDIDLLVMGSANRTGVTGLFFGNTAERLLDKVEASVLIVKPTDFSDHVSGMHTADTQ